MEEIVLSLNWDTRECPSPGAHSSLPDDSGLPWHCRSEVIPGLFLTCEAEVSDRPKCVQNGNALILNLCGDPHVSKYRVYERTESGPYVFRRFEEQRAFYVELNEYCQQASSTPLESRKVFIVTIPAEDNPNYSIDVHFVECVMLIELVLRARGEVADCSDASYAALPSVVVHCMVGVSRSASVVIAYMMKRFNMSRDEAIYFIRCTRPVIQPNPGFQRQLELWESLKGFRVANEFSAMVLSAEAKAKANLLEVVSTILPTILHAKKCDSERQFFGAFLKNVMPDTDEQHAVYRELRSTVTVDVDCEMYTDIPNYFGYVAEVVCSVDTAFPTLLQYAGFWKSVPVYSDSFYYRVVKDIARSGFEEDTFDTVRGFCSLFDSIYVKHLCEIGDGRPLEVGDTESRPLAPSGCSLSFPFLFLVAPYAEGFVQFSEWGALAESFPTTGAVLTAQVEQQLSTVVLDVFLQFFFRSSCSSAEAASTAIAPADEYTKLAYLHDDIEIATFRKLEEQLHTNGSIATVDKVLVQSDADTAQVALLLLLKAVSGVVAFRTVLEAAEQFLSQTYSARLSAKANIADKRFPLHLIASGITSASASFASKYSVSFNLEEFFKSELAGLCDNGVLNASGVASIFHGSA